MTCNVATLPHLCHQAKTTARHGLNLKGSDQRGLCRQSKAPLESGIVTAHSGFEKAEEHLQTARQLCQKEKEQFLWLRHWASVRSSFTAITFLFVSISCTSVLPYGAEVIMLLPFLACFASLLGQGVFVAPSVGQQGSCGQSVLHSHLTMWGKSILSNKLAGPVGRVLI